MITLDCNSQFNNDLENLFNSQQFTWLVTGAAGFIGSHLSYYLLKYNQKVIAIDNFSTGQKSNLDYLSENIDRNILRRNFFFYEIDAAEEKDLFNCLDSYEIDYVLHQAALGSVPRSIKDPLRSHNANVNSFSNILSYFRLKQIKKIVYASSSSVYGDDINLPKVENKTGNVLSPYALTKLTNENYAELFSKQYGINILGLRYFNVFGPRQNPLGEYAAVIPKWINLIMHNKRIEIYGDGETSRDFCYIKNVVQANFKAAISSNTKSHQVINIACEDTTSLNQLAQEIEKNARQHLKDISLKKDYLDFRAGDIKSSLADISKAKKLINYIPIYNFNAGLEETMCYIFSNKIN